MNIQEKTNRMCDAALDHIKGIADDLGLEEAIHVYTAQTMAFWVLLVNELGSKELATSLMIMKLQNLLTNILKT